jgi:hypothetical protein
MSNNVDESMRDNLESDTMAIIKRQNEIWREVARLNEEQEKAHGFSPLVADAINLLRHKKVGRWERGYAYDDEKYDHAAEAIAEGLRDREKQSALYIGVSKNGTVCSRPDEVKKETIALAVEHSKKLGEFLSRLLDRGGGGIEFDCLIENLKVMFASQEELRVVFPKP